MPKRKRRQVRQFSPSQSAASSSVSSVSSGDEEISEKGSNNMPPKSVFSGFWSDGEHVDETTKKKRGGKKVGKRSDKSNGNRIVDYEGFYLNIGDTIYEIGLGDVVAMRNTLETPIGSEDGSETSDEEDNGEGHRDKKRVDGRRNRRSLFQDDSEIKEAEVVASEYLRSKETAMTTNSSSNPQVSLSEYAADALAENPSKYYQASTPKPAAATIISNNIKKGKHDEAIEDDGTVVLNETTKDINLQNAPKSDLERNGNYGGNSAAATTTALNSENTAQTFFQTIDDTETASKNHRDKDLKTDAETKTKQIHNTGDDDPIPDVSTSTNDVAMISASTPAVLESSEKEPPSPPSPQRKVSPGPKNNSSSSKKASSAVQQLPPQPPRREAKIGDGLMLARVERIWHEKALPPKKSGGGGGSKTTTSSGNNSLGGRVLFKARWFLKKNDVDALPLAELSGPVDSKVFAKTVTQHDLVLSNQCDDNHVTTICDIVQVLYRNPKLDVKMPNLILPATYLCRYSLSIDESQAVIMAFSGESDDWKEMTVSALNSKKRSINDGSDDNSGNGEHFLHNLLSPAQSKGRKESGVDELLSPRKRRRVGDFADADGIDEGSTEQRDIQIGSDHQVYVPSFVPNQKIISRNPVRVWTPDKISQDGIDDYIELAAQVLTPYLREHHLTMEEPYVPFPTKRMEELSRMLHKKRLPSLSSVSSASSLTSYTTDALREFNVDALLRNLHVSNYNVGMAMATIKASPADYIGSWSPHEKARFNTGFRRYSGSLRAIHKGMGDKELQDVIDYHYRFKIPDQFRKVQERKREQAVRMLEAIETKRNVNAPIMISSGHYQNGSFNEHKHKLDWTKTGSASLVVSLEERRIKAKQLLLDAETKLGRTKMMKVFEIFQNVEETALVECKTKLLEVLRGNKGLQSRFLEFLPQQLRI